MQFDLAEALTSLFLYKFTDKLKEAEEMAMKEY